jgi:hypothetical protein
MMGRMRTIEVAIAAVSVSMAAEVAWSSDEVSAEKSAYHLFNPTPHHLLRELSADRPDGTESPHTVDAGHVQIEMSFVDYSRSSSAGVETRIRTFAEINFKLGLTNDIDLQLIFSPSVDERMQTPGMLESRITGASDVTVRTKFNIWGNDSGETAFAVMPFVTVPTSTDVSSGEWEGGLIAALGWSVSEGVGLGLMVEGDIVYDDDTGSHEFDFVHTAVLGFELFGPVSAYVEYIGAVSTNEALGYRPMFSAGVTVALGDDIVLDAGLRKGFGRHEEDVGVFAGMTIRF